MVGITVCQELCCEPWHTRPRVLFIRTIGDTLGWNHWMLFWVALKSSCYHSAVYLSTKKFSARGKVQDKKWFRIGRLWGLQEMPYPENLLGYSFVIKGKVAGQGVRGGSSSFLSRHHASVISSSSSLGRGVFPCPCVVKLVPQIIVLYKCREHVLGSLTY